MVLAIHMKVLNFSWVQICIHISSRMVKGVLDLTYYQSGEVSYRNCHRGITPFAMYEKMNQADAEDES